MYSLHRLIGAALRPAMFFVGGRQVVDKASTTLAGRCSCAAATAWGFLWQPPASRIEVLGLVAVMLLCCACLRCLLE